MGTELYQRGQFINNPFEGINLREPDLVRRIHREYVDAGAEVIETNTFAANRLKLRRVGLEDEHDAINRTGVNLAREAAAGRAWVVGAIGPSGKRWVELTDRERDELCAVFVDQATVLLDAGVDGLSLETFGTLEELRVALRSVRSLTDLPILASAAFLGNGVTADGAAPDVVARALASGGADLVGANCADGPMELHAIAEAMLPVGRPVAILPNAGYPKHVDGRMIYMATPEYFGVFARRFLKLGVTAIGGCCGTSPAHIRAMSGAVRMMSGGTEPAIAPSMSVRERQDTPALTDEATAPVPFAERSSLAGRIAGTEGFVVSVEVNPPTGLDPSRAIEGARMLQAAGVDVINIADGPRASVRMSNWALALEVQRAIGMEAIVHLCARDRNLLGLQSDLLAYHQLGLRNLVVITGDPPKLGDYPHATAVFDLDSIGILRMVNQLNHGLNPVGRAIGATTAFAAACGVEPAALDYDRELRRLEEKVEAGASWIMTQPVYDPTVLERFLDDIEDFEVPVLVGLMPLASHRNAEFLHNEVPGMQIPQHIRDRMERVGRGPAARAEGVRIAQEALLAVRARVRGAYIMPPFGRWEAAVEILECIGYARPDAWRETWRD
ncbi:MAG: bifunctional homocysteine S-methyltransferase/methylenetetrahydrofolate reductase [Deltaproteobacteria bacterium]|nr:MAG: bifunctional homocysteine S-methyltransferase/methylenetetrahydrofolate reductase [Deltaproteobacteria bacterium]